MTRELTGVEGPHADATLETGGAPAAAARVALILVHGRGGTPEGMIRLADELYVPGTALFAPGAVRSNWFPAAHDAPIEVNEPALTSAVDCVAETVDAARGIGLDFEQIVLVGISQGGSVVGEFLRRHPRRYGGAFVISAALPGPTVETFATEESGTERIGTTVKQDPESIATLDGTPVTLESSENDPYVSSERVRTTAATFEQRGVSVDLRIDDGDEHGVSESMIERIAAHLEILRDRATTESA